MKNKTLFIIIFVVALLVLAKIFFLQPEESAPAGPGKQGGPATATGFVVSSSVLENNIFSSGTVLASEEVELRPETNGKLTNILFKEGGMVQKGELLVKINDADLQAQLKKLTLQYKLAKEKETRLKGLLDIKGVSQEEYDVASSLLETTEADMDYVKAQISKTEIRAPFNGRIGLKNVSEGSFVNNATLIATMQQTDLLKIDFSIPEKYASTISVGDSVKFSIEGSMEKFVAAVDAIEPKINVQTRSMNIRAAYKNKDHLVYPGAFAKIELVAGKKRSSFMIPSQAVIPEMKGKKVFVSKNGKAMPVKVETGIRTDLKIEVISGLQAGDTVITTGIMSLRPETPVKIISVEK